MREIRKGDTFKSRSGVEYIVTAVDPKGGFHVGRAAGSSVAVGVRKLASAKKLLETEGRAKCQANPSKGGFSYTVAVDAAVAWALECTEIAGYWVKS
jgi:hypothetical protein